MTRALLFTAAVALTACTARTTQKVIVFGVDGMDPSFVERHWADLPALHQLRREGTFSRLATTNPPQSPVAWSTFITGLHPGDHGIFDFVHRDPDTHEPYLSISRIVPPRFHLTLGPWDLPFSPARVELLRHGLPFWATLADRGIPVSIVHMPANFPPSASGEQLSGMGVPDLRGTQGTYTLIDHPGVTNLQGPPNTLRRDRAITTAPLKVDIDPDRPVARLQLGGQTLVLNEGEWSAWLPVDFPLMPSLAAAHGMVRIFAKRLHPDVAIYLSPVNLNPARPALPISTPPSLARAYANAIGPYPTLGIPQDTAALRAGVLTLPEFLVHTRDILNTERRLLSAALDRYQGGLLFFYFSSIDQNSHILWGKYEAELLTYYQSVDAAIADARRREPGAQIMVMSDHGFSTFERAVNLNTWLRQEGLQSQAWALGLNGLYVTKNGDAKEVRRRLLELQDPQTNRPAITAISINTPSSQNQAVAPTMEIGYAKGYRASWATALGELSDQVFETNTDAWIGDHCLDPAAVPGVLFTSKGVSLKAPAIKDLPAALIRLFDGRQ